MTVTPGSSEPRILIRDSGIGMPPTDSSANVDSSKDNEEEWPGEVTYEIRYENPFGGHLHSETLKRRAHEYEQSTLPQSSVM